MAEIPENQALVLVSRRCDDGAPSVPGSGRGRCHECGAPVWVSPASLEAMGASVPEGLIASCLECFALRADDPDHEYMQPTPGQVREARELFGP